MIMFHSNFYGNEMFFLCVCVQCSFKSFELCLMCAVVSVLDFEYFRVCLSVCARDFVCLCVCKLCV